MLTFEPYGNPTYFALLGVALLPLMIGLLYGKRSRLYETLVSIFFLVLTFGGSKWTQGVAFSKQDEINHLYNLLTSNEQHEVTAQCNQKAVHNL